MNLGLLQTSYGDTRAAEEAYRRALQFNPEYAAARDEFEWIVQREPDQVEAAGGRSGLSSVVTALLFLSALFFAPLFTVVPPYAYGPALIIVGMLMLSPMKHLEYSDLTEVIPAFTVIVLMSFTYNIGIGMTAGFVVYPLIKVLSNKAPQVPAGLWALGGMSLLFFLFYPY